MGVADEAGVAIRIWTKFNKDVVLAQYNPFVVSLATGTLKMESFQQYMAQDAYFLKAFVQVFVPYNSDSIFQLDFKFGNNGGHKSVETSKDGQIILPLLIEVPRIPIEELKEEIDNFSPKSLIGEGSCGRVYYSVLRSGRTATIKKLDTSKKPDQEFLAQVSMVSKVKHENVLELVGYCVEGIVRVLAYEFATMGSLHDILHGMWENAT